jgi:hypothetical protein
MRGAAGGALVGHHMDQQLRAQLIAMGVPPALIVASGISVSDYNDGRVVLMLHPIQWTSTAK